MAGVELEARVAVLEERIENNRDDIKEIKDLIKSHTEAEMNQMADLHDAVLKAQTGWKVLAWLGGVGTTIVGVGISLWKVLHG